MPKIAIISDIHSNGDAFDVVLEKCRELKVDSYISLGDIVGYNAEPVKCMQLAESIKWLDMVRGNHDDCISSGDTEMSGFNENAQKAVLWTRTQLDAHQLESLRTPFVRTQPQYGITLVHATLDTPETWGYVIDAFHAEISFEYQKSALCFCGHSHIPVAFDKTPFAADGRGVQEIVGWRHNADRPQNDTDFTQADELCVHYLPGHKYLFNIGSVGQPRNHDPRASFAVIDTEERAVIRYRLPYDVAAQQNKVRDAGLPERLAMRLAKGI